jgi:hypothetical protein
LEQLIVSPFQVIQGSSRVRVECVTQIATACDWNHPKGGTNQILEKLCSIPETFSEEVIRNFNTRRTVSECAEAILKGEDIWRGYIVTSPCVYATRLSKLTSKESLGSIHLQAQILKGLDDSWAVVLGDNDIVPKHRTSD